MHFLLEFGKDEIGYSCVSKYHNDNFLGWWYVLEYLDYDILTDTYYIRKIPTDILRSNQMYGKKNNIISIHKKYKNVYLIKTSLNYYYYFNKEDGTVIDVSYMYKEEVNDNSTSKGWIRKI